MVRGLIEIDGWYRAKLGRRTPAVVRPLCSAHARLMPLLALAVALAGV